jgi:predicted metalloprotease with PDZ domain
MTTYTVMQIADSSYQGASGLEHQNSHVNVLTPIAVGNPLLDGLYAHETVHAWNVKRLRPSDLWPYRYDRSQPTTWLWVSEGITDYYADLVMVRAGLHQPAEFYANATGKIQNVENAPPVALEDASLSTWVHPTDGTGYLYYDKGSLAGLLLDILIRDASDNRRSLDDVMRSLYRSSYRQGRGFTAEEWWKAVSAAAGGKSFADFHARYVDGREAYPWNEVLPLAGLRRLREPRLGVSTRADSTGVFVESVVPGSAAALAGVEAGDRLLKVGEVDIANQDFGPPFRSRYAGAEGQAIPIVVLRAGETKTLEGKLQFSGTRVEEDPGASAKAVRIREGLLKGMTEK